MKDNKVYIIAELSANHNGSIDIAKETISAAKRAGADAIKLQTYTPDTITIDSNLEDFVIKGGTLWDNKTLYNLYQEAYTPWEWHEELFNHAKEEKIDCFSSPFDLSAVKFLEQFNPPAYKIASFEITDIPLIEYTAKMMRPMIISTGVAEYEDILLAIETCRNVGNNDITILKCTSSYPAPLDEANLIMIQKIKKDFNVKVGLSDHTLGNLAPVIATSLGASVIEKHFILDKKIGGPDSEFSLDEKEFTEMVNNVRLAELALGKETYELTSKQKLGKQFTRSLYVTKEISEGEIFSEENIRSIRPGYGIHPKHLNKILGKKSNTKLTKGLRFSLKYIDNE